MDIEYKGGNCVIITSKKATFVVDPNVASLGLKPQGQKAAVHLLTQKDMGANASEDTLVFSGPGEYEVENISIRGVAAQAHIDAKTEPMRATMYRLASSEFSIGVIGHVHPDLSEQQLEALGVLDVLIIPVGGNGYTLDATGAIQIIRAVNPKIVIPTHYKDEDITYPVSQAGLEEFVKDLGAPQEESSRLKLKPGAIGEALTVQVVQRTA